MAAMKPADMSSLIIFVAVIMSLPPSLYFFGEFAIGLAARNTG
jgi:hypothetical protein